MEENNSPYQKILRFIAVQSVPFIVLFFYDSLYSFTRLESIFAPRKCRGKGTNIRLGEKINKIIFYNYFRMNFTLVGFKIVIGL